MTGAPSGLLLSAAATGLARAERRAPSRPRPAQGWFNWTVRRIGRQRGGRVAAIALIALITIALAAPWLAPFDPDEVGAGSQFASPSREHLFGTDELGRDVLSRIIYGARISLMVAVLAAGGALLLALPFGLLAGYIGGLGDAVISRLFDTILAFPAILLGIALVAVRGAGLANVILAVAIIYVPTLGRLIRASVLNQRVEEYVEAARALGVPGWLVLGRHIFPNVLPPLLVQMTVIMADAVLLEAAFSFLGLGIPPPQPSWGTMLDGARNYLYQAPWLGIFAGAAITVLILALNALGDALRVALDPRRP